MTAALEALAAKWEREAKLAERAALLDGVPGSSEAIYECAAELRAALAESGWQPIETAPKDGRYLVYNEMVGIYMTEPRDGEWPIWAWARGMERFFPRPSHWQPLPSPPEPPR